MFTGLVEALGTVVSATPAGDGRRLRLAAPFAAELAIGDSVAVSGACLTVVARDADAFEVETVAETLAKTTLGGLEPGDRVNLERALRAGDRLDGHFVLGHVDTTGEVADVAARETGWEVRVAFPEAFAAYLVPVGSVAVDGVSLTVARLGDADFTVALIPHTLAVTTAGAWQSGHRVNLEFDVLGKYAVRAMGLRG